jgi:hypothetical protein
MATKTITATEALDYMQTWIDQSQRVCFAVCVGDVAWHAFWIGTLHEAGLGRWVIVSDHMTNMVRPDQYGEIILTEDRELLGIRFRKPRAFSARGFEVDLFIDKHNGFDEAFVALVNKMVD